MFGKPKNIDGNCNAVLYLGDDYGDGTCTIRCKLPEKHLENHKEIFLRNEKEVIITWVDDERETEFLLTFSGKFEDVESEIWGHAIIISSDMNIITVHCDKNKVDELKKIPGIINLKENGLVE